MLCDIVLTSIGSLSHVRDGLDALFSNADPRLFRLSAVVSNADSHTEAYLGERFRRSGNASVHRAETPGRAAEVFDSVLRNSPAPYVLHLECGAMLPPKWLERMARCLGNRPGTASASAVPASWRGEGVRIPPGSSFLSADDFLRGSGVDSSSGTGRCGAFCRMYKTAEANEAGGLAPAFRDLAKSLADLDRRLSAMGYRTAVCGVLALRAGTCLGRSAACRQVKKRVADASAGEGLCDPFSSFRRLFPVRTRRAPLFCFKGALAKARRKARAGDFGGAALEVLRGLGRSPFFRREMMDVESLSEISNRERLRVVYVLPTVAVSGGVLSVVQIVNELILLGVDAGIAVFEPSSEDCDWKFFFRPMEFANPKELAENFPEVDVAVATHFKTAPLVSELARSGRARACYYFLQDYESWFFPEKDAKSRALVKGTYGLIEDKVVKSEWLRGMLEKDGFPSRKIRLGMDLSVFYPRDAERGERPVVLAMARPRTPRRGCDTLVEALAEVERRMPRVRIVLFGDTLRSGEIPFPFEDMGVVRDRNRLARLYSSADVFVDASHFQGFGRTALEAMACGTACVVTNVGGVSEYARNGENCISAPPKDPGLLARGIVKLLRDVRLRERLAENGLETARGFCHKREAGETLRYLRDLMERSGK